MTTLLVIFFFQLGFFLCGLAMAYYVLARPLLALAMNTHESTATGLRTLRQDIYAELRYFPKRHMLLTLWIIVIAGYQIAVTPIKNPFAHDAVTIRGRFPFDQGFELIFTQNAYGDATWFRRLCGGINIEEAVCGAGYEVLKPVKIDGKHYELTVYRDRYFHGLAEWRPGLGLNHYKAGTPEPTGSYSFRDGNQACDGSEQARKKFQDSLYCTDQTRDKDYKTLVITDGQPVKPNERLINFWLYPELDAMLKERK